MRKSHFFGIFTLIFFVQCSEAQNEAVTKNKSITPTIQYLALGDSYTIGESVDPNYRFANLLVSKLRMDGINSEANILATTGWTTDELIAAIDSDIDNGSEYDMVSLLIGVNNQYRGYPIVQYNDEFRRLLNTAIELAGGNLSKVFVLSIPDYSVTPFGQSRPESHKIASEIDEYNKIAEEICNEKGIEFFDITTLSRQALSDPELIASDGLHPSEQMYVLWVDKIFKDVKSLILK